MFDPSNCPCGVDHTAETMRRQCSDFDLNLLKSSFPQPEAIAVADTLDKMAEAIGDRMPLVAAICQTHEQKDRYMYAQAAIHLVNTLEYMNIEPRSEKLREVLEAIETYYNEHGKTAATRAAEGSAEKRALLDKLRAAVFGGGAEKAKPEAN